MKKIFCLCAAVMTSMFLCACGTKDEESSVKDALEILQTVWNSYDEDEKFSAAGGDMTEENMATDAPGKFGTGDAEMLDYYLGFPKDSAEQVDNAASLMHMMNANTFTCGAFCIKDDGNITALTSALKDNIQKRQWMCGFPDKLVIVTQDNCIISFFGETETVGTFRQKLLDAYPQAQVVCEEDIR